MKSNFYLLVPLSRIFSRLHILILTWLTVPARLIQILARRGTVPMDAATTLSRPKVARLFLLLIGMVGYAAMGYAQTAGKDTNEGKQGEGKSADTAVVMRVVPRPESPKNLQPFSTSGHGLSPSHTDIVISPDGRDPSDPGAPDRTDPIKPLLNDNYGHGGKHRLAAPVYANAMGSLSSNIQIICDGHIGIKPSLNIVYNHQGGRGIAGYGWDLQGLSVISVRALNYAMDGVSRAANPEEIDGDATSFALDGQRLIKSSLDGRTVYYVSGTGQTVRCERADQGGGWIVYTPDGRIREYALSDRSVHWYLTSETDAYGNYISYEYSRGDRKASSPSETYLIERILYGGNSRMGQKHLFSIFFYYQWRSDASTSYMAGLPFDLSRCLKSISTPTMSYEFAYAAGRYALLSGIKSEPTSSSPCFEESCVEQFEENLQFSYGQPGGFYDYIRLPKDGLLDAEPRTLTLNTKHGLDGRTISNTRMIWPQDLRIEKTSLPYNYFPNGDKENLNVICGRFTGYGLEEGAVIVPKSKPDEWVSNKSQLLFIPTLTDPQKGWGNFENALALEVGNSFIGSCTYTDRETPTTQQVALCNIGPSTDDGRTRIILKIFSRYGPETSYHHREFVIGTNVESRDFKAGGGFIPTGVQPFGDGKSYIGLLYPKTTYKADKKHAQISLKLADPHMGYDLDADTDIRIAWNDLLLLTDMDGDGRDDLFLVHSKGFAVYSIDPIAGEYLKFRLWEKYNGNSVKLKDFQDPNRIVKFGDVNGDGLVDIIRSPFPVEDSSEPEDGHLDLECWNFIINTGRRFIKKAVYIDKQVFPVHSPFDFLCQDIDGDGCADLAQIDGNKLRIVYSHRGLPSAEHAVSFEVQGLNPAGKLFTVENKMTNPNRVIGYIHQNTLAKITLRKNEAVNALLTSIKDQRGVQARIQYSRADQDSAVYEYPDDRSKLPGPHAHLIAPFWLPKTIRTDMPKDAGRQEIGYVQYKYGGGVIHRQGLGFLGFDYFGTEDKISKATQHEFYNPMRRNILIRRVGKTARERYTYNLPIPEWNEDGMVQMKRSEVEDLLSGVKTEKTYSYGSHGLPIAIQTRLGQEMIREEQISYHPPSPQKYGERILIGLPAEKTAKTSNAVNSQVEATKIWYTNYGAPARVQKWINNVLAEQKDFDYEPHGRVQKEKTIPYGRAELATEKSCTYGGNNNTLLTSTDERGLVSTYDCDALGRPKSIRNHNYQDIEKKWSKLNQVYMTRSILGVTTRTSFLRDRQSGCYRTIVKNDYGQETESVEDALGRVILERNKMMGGKQSYKETIYDALGQVSKRSLPYTPGETKQWITYTYDEYGRPTREGYPDGTEKTYSYTANTISTTERGITTEKTYNEAGQIILSKDPTGSIRYKVRVDGKPAELIYNGGKISCSYDALGRRTEIHDPNAGRRTTAYDIQNDGIYVETQTNATGETVKTQTNKLGELVKIERSGINEFNTSFFYDNEGRMTHEYSSNRTGATFAYDIYGRLKKQTKTVMLLETEQQYEYNKDLCTKMKTKLPDGSSFSEIYTYELGELVKIQIPSTLPLGRLVSVMEIQETNAAGNALQVKTGPLTRTYTYDIMGRELRRQVGDILDRAYTYDAYSNITERTDRRKAIREAFAYDKMQRLSGEEHPADQGKRSDGTSHPITSYDQRGNKFNLPYAAGNLVYGDGIRPDVLVGLQAKRRPLITTANSPENNIQETVHTGRRQVAYAAFDRPADLTTDEYTLSWTYNAAHQRATMQVEPKNGLKPWKRYYLDAYEKDQGKGREIQRYYLAGDAYSAPAVYIKEAEKENEWQLLYILRDRQGSILALTDAAGKIIAEQEYDAWGLIRRPDGGKIEAQDQINGQETRIQYLLARGYTGHEHLPAVGLINMNARLYEPAIGRFISPDPYIQKTDRADGLNRYVYCLNNPMSYIDQSGELAWFIPIIIGAAIFGVGNLTAHAIRGDIRDFWTGLKYLAQGALTGALVGAAWQFAPLIPFAGTIIQTGMTIHGLVQVSGLALGTVAGVITGLVGGGWRTLGNSYKLFLGNFYLDENASFFAGVGEGLSRHSWEMVQNSFGHTYSQIRNMVGGVDRVDYFGGATFSTKKIQRGGNGISLGAFININTDEKIGEDFDKHVTSDPLYMHEYGHSFDSRSFGLLYLPVIGLASGISAATSTPKTHSKRWYERLANRHASKYFRNYFDVDWSQYESEYPL